MIAMAIPVTCPLVRNGGQVGLARFKSDPTRVFPAYL